MCRVLQRELGVHVAWAWHRFSQLFPPATVCVCDCTWYNRHDIWIEIQWLHCWEALSWNIGTYCLLLFSKRTFFAVHYFLQQRYIIQPALYMMKLKTKSVFAPPPKRPAPNHASLMLPGDNLSISSSQTRASCSMGARLQRIPEVNRPSEAHLLLWCSGTGKVQVNRESPPAQSKTVTCNWGIICLWGPKSFTFFFFFQKTHSPLRWRETGIFPPLTMWIMGQNKNVPKDERQDFFFFHFEPFQPWKMRPDRAQWSQYTAPVITLLTWGAALDAAKSVMRMIGQIININ